jgi:membrane-associated phospholipid phosphatase
MSPAENPWNASPGEPLGQVPDWRHIFKVTILLLWGALVALSFDAPLGILAIDEVCPRSIHEFLQTGEAFGHGLGVALILLAVWLLDVPGRKRIPRIVGVVLAAGLSADLIKLFVGRARPRSFSFEDTHILDSFVTLLPMARNGTGAQGFPSAHTATAVGLALALAWAYPRGRFLFGGLAAMVALQRIETGAHFASDVLVGAAVGWLAGSYMLCPDSLFGGMQKVEVWFEQRFGQSPAQAGSRLNLPSPERAPQVPSQTRAA